MKLSAHTAKGYKKGSAVVQMVGGMSANYFVEQVGLRNATQCVKPLKSDESTQLFLIKPLFMKTFEFHFVNEDEEVQEILDYVHDFTNY